jgi:hypothetical protein
MMTFTASPKKKSASSPSSPTKRPASSPSSPSLKKGTTSPSSGRSQPSSPSTKFNAATNRGLSPRALISALDLPPAVLPPSAGASATAMANVNKGTASVDTSSQLAAAVEAFSQFVHTYGCLLCFHTVPAPAALSEARLSFPSYLNLLPRLHCLQVSNHTFDTAAVHGLARYLLRPECTLRTLSLNKVELQPEHAFVLAAAIRRESLSHVLDATAAAATSSPAALAVGALTAPASSLAPTSSLTELLISHNNVSLLGVAAFLTCPSLSTLDASFNDIQGSKLPAEVAAQIKCTCQLQVLRLGNNALGAIPIMWPATEQLEREFGRVGRDGSFAWCHPPLNRPDPSVKVPRRCLLPCLPSTLSQLDLDHNVLSTFRFEPCPALSRLARLSMAFNDLGTSTMRTLVRDFFPHLTGLHTLDVSWNNFDDMSSLVQGLCKGLLPRCCVLIVMQMFLDVSTRRFLSQLQNAEAHSLAFAVAGSHPGYPWTLQEVWVSRGAYRADLQSILTLFRQTKVLFK